MNAHQSDHPPLLPSERLALAIYRFTESAGVGQWQTSTIAQLGNSVDCHDARLSDALKALCSNEYLELRKWQPDIQRFVPFALWEGTEDEFFYRADFQIKVGAKGRPYFERFEAREQIEKLQSAAAATVSSTGARSLSRLLKVFLCHASEDKSAVRNLYQRLRSDGFSPWLDEEDLLPGQEWELEIRKAVRASDVVLVCLSSASITKEGFVQKEIRLALDAADEKPEGTIFVIPAKLEQCRMPERLSKWHWVELYRPEGYINLLRAIRIRATALGIVEPAITGVPTIELRADPPPEHGVSADEIAKKFTEVVGRHEQAQRTAQSLEETRARFDRIAREQGPAEFERLAELLKTQADDVNSKRHPGMPVLQYVPINHRLEAGKFTVELSPFPARIWTRTRRLFCPP